MQKTIQVKDLAPSCCLLTPLPVHQRTKLVRRQLMSRPLMSSLTVWVNSGKLPGQTPSNLRSGRIWRRKGPVGWVSHEHEPGVTARIIGDGNCFFRTLSYFLTDAQREHQHLGALLCLFMCENNEQFNAIANQKDYVITSKVSQLGEYATEVEIFAAATFLGTPI